MTTGTASDLAKALRRDVQHGLTQSPKTLPPKWFYDAKGSDLFDQITRLPEYYPTRTEASILQDRAADIAAASGADTLVELGSGTSEKTTIGNLTSQPRAEFLAALADSMQPGDSLLLGTDLVKDVGRLVRAYDDSAGVTAAFNRNVLAVVNRELDADFDLDAFDHVARWNPEQERIEMWLRSTTDQRVRIGQLDLTVDFAAGEEMLTEVSCKFRPEGVEAELAAAGLRRTHWWSDGAGDFGLSLAVK
ncbi:MAG: putative methyltransferase [Mycobacterium sp.]|nr:putative methyltransferase [Mycobacterium sp.]